MNDMRAYFIKVTYRTPNGHQRDKNFGYVTHEDAQIVASILTHMVKPLPEMRELLPKLTFAIAPSMGEETFRPGLTVLMDITLWLKGFAARRTKQKP